MPAAQALYPTSMSPPSVEQALSALRVIRVRARMRASVRCVLALTPCVRPQGADGTGRGAAKLQALRDNSNFVRDELRAMGCEVLGDQDSPVCVAALSLLSLLMLHAPSRRRAAVLQLTWVRRSAARGR
jgi:hypothetical protein